MSRPRPIVLVVLDGFGIGDGGPARRHRRRTHADLARAPGPLAAQPAAGVGGCGRPATGPDGQLRGRAPQPRRRPAGAPGPAPHRRRHRRRHVLHAAGAHRGVRTGPRPRQRPGRGQPDRSRRRPRQRPAPRGARRTRRSGARLECAHPRPARRPRHAAVLGARVRRRPRGTARGGPPGRRGRDGRRPLLRDGPRPALGARRDRLRRHRPRRSGPPRRFGGRRHRGRLRPRRDRRVRQPHRHRRPGDAAGAGRSRRHRELPRRPGAPAHPRPGRRAGVRRLRSHVAEWPTRPGRPLRGDHDRVRGGPAASRSPSRPRPPGRWPRR